MTFHEQYIVDDHGQPTAVVLPIAEWHQVLERLEDLEDVRAYDAAKREPGDPISFAQAEQEIRAGRSD